MKITFVVTHLLGTGHLSRTLTLARAAIAAGHNAQVITGGMPAPHLDQGDIPLVQLPPVRSDGVDFARLLDQGGATVTPALLEARAHQLIHAMQHEAPDVLITELFPFGRRILRAEFEAVLQTARRRPDPPLVCASIRDILAPPSKPRKAVFADDMIAQFYDAVLVHARADITPLTLSWPVSDRLSPKLVYTGFVAPPAPLPHPDKAGAGEVLVSAGGGDVGGDIFACAMAAARLDTGRRWRMLLGGQDAAARAGAIADKAPDNMVVEAARPDFRQMLHHAAVSVSMCGYNTALDVLQTGVAAVFIPFDAGSEVEQGLRADALARTPGIAVVRSAALTPQTLLDAVDQVGTAPPRAGLRDGLDGAAETLRQIVRLRESQR